MMHMYTYMYHYLLISWSSVLHAQKYLPNYNRIHIRTFFVYEKATSEKKKENIQIFLPLFFRCITHLDRFLKSYSVEFCKQTTAQVSFSIYRNINVKTAKSYDINKSSSKRNFPLDLQEGFSFNLFQYMNISKMPINETI
jgi:hypothetical protein